MSCNNGVFGLLIIQLVHRPGQRLRRGGERDRSDDRRQNRILNRVRAHG